MAGAVPGLTSDETQPHGQHSQIDESDESILRSS
jgi:hypothetical protein